MIIGVVLMIVMGVLLYFDLMIKIITFLIPFFWWVCWILITIEINLIKKSCKLNIVKIREALSYEVERR